VARAYSPGSPLQAVVGDPAPGWSVMASQVGNVSSPAITVSRTSSRAPGRVLFAAGLIAFSVMMACYCAFIVTHPMDRWMSPADLHVYRLGGKVVAQVAPTYNAGVAAPLYDWPGDGLKFTYTPFAAMVFTLLWLPSWTLLLKLSIGASIAAMVAAIWATLGGLGYRAGLARLGGTLLLAAALFWTEPVQRTLYLGQIELLLMALIMWDMSQPDRRRWKGVGVGLAAGIKLVPLVFIPYLLLTRRFRQAAVAGGTFVATIVLGFAVLPADSRVWWLHGLFLQGSRTGFIGWEGNQSLQAIITRFAGSIAAGQPIWLVVAFVTLLVGVASAVALDKAGHRTVAVLTCALTGLLVSPVSWDHHWVWVVPAVTVLVVYGIRARAALRWVYLAGAALLAALFGAWPGFLWGQPLDLGGFSEGLIWIPPNTNPGTSAQLGDRPWYAEYHWHGSQLVTGNLFVLTGIAMFVLLAVLAVRRARAHHPLETAEAALVTGAEPVTIRSLAGEAAGSQG
jgi:alpha-1,2-mannosyltransferase